MAISLPLLDLDRSGLPIDPSKPSLVYCHEGFRATTAASILLQKRAGAIAILIDGIEGWSALGLPLEIPDKSSSYRHSPDFAAHDRVRGATAQSPVEGERAMIRIECFLEKMAEREAALTTSRDYGDRRTVSSQLDSLDEEELKRLLETFERATEVETWRHV